MLRLLAVLLVLVTVSGGCGTDHRADADAAVAGAAASFTAIRDDIFTTSCGFGSCHAGATPAAHLDLRTGDVCGALVGRASCLFPGKQLVAPGKPELSFLLDKLHGTRLADMPASACADSNEPMPFGAPPLSPEQLAQIEQWIRAGAPCERSGTTGETGDAGVGTPAAVASIAAAATTLRAGEHTYVTITLVHPAPAGGQTLDLDVADASVLGVASAVHVEAGLSSLTVDVVGKRPSRPVLLTASSGSSSRSISISVAGLVLSEIEFDPLSTDDGYEWIELANTTDVAIDLAAYTLGSGRTSYTYSLAPLAGTIPAHGCFVIGGPLGASNNNSPQYGQAFNFSPDLVNGSSSTGQAAGFALFDVSITHVTAMTTPLDAVLVGQHNDAGLVDARGHVAAPSVSDVAAGHSISRSTATTWVDQPSPTPNQCALH